MATLGKEHLFYRHMLGALERNFVNIARAIAQIGCGLQVHTLIIQYVHVHMYVRVCHIYIYVCQKNIMFPPFFVICVFSKT